MAYGIRLTVEDRISTLFQLDPVVPAQYSDTFRRKAPLEPEKALMLAVLEDAIMCFQTYASARDSKTGQLSREAEDWILEKNSQWLFSFEQICAVFGLDPGYVRKGLLKAKERLTRVSKDGDGSSDNTRKKRCKRKNVRLAA